MALDDYLRELTDGDRPLVVSKLANLSGLRPDELDAFRDLWRQADVERRRQVIDTLAELTEDNVELDFDAVFFVGLRDADADVRAASIRSLWEHEGRDLIKPLLEVLAKDEDDEVRAEAALALGRFVVKGEFDELRPADDRAIEEGLRRVIDAGEEEDVDVRARAIEAVGAWSRPWVADVIRDAYGSEERRLRVGAVHAMGRSCDVRWLPAIIQELGSDDPEMRFEAASACGAVAEAQAVPHLLNLLEDEDAEVQEAAVRALGEIGGRAARSALQRVARDGEPRLSEAAEAALAEADFDDDSLGYRQSG